MSEPEEPSILKRVCRAMGWPEDAVIEVDVEPKPGWEEELLKALDEPRPSVVESVILDGKGLEPPPDQPIQCPEKP